MIFGTGTLPELVPVVLDGPTHLHAQTDEEASSPRLSIYPGILSVQR